LLTLNIFKIKTMIGFIVLPLGAAGVTFVCNRYHISYEMGTIARAFFGGVFFTFAITLSTVNKRRFDAFDEIAILKGNALTFHQLFKLYFKGEQLADAQNNLLQLFINLHAGLRTPDLRLSSSALHEVDKVLNQLMTHIYQLKQQGLHPPEVSRLYQWHQDIYKSSERLVAIKEHNIPVLLRVFIRYSMLISIFVLAPDFVHLGNFGILLSAMLCFMVVTLLSIQDHLEDPFDDDVDSVCFDFYDRLKIRMNAKFF